MISLSCDVPRPLCPAGKTHVSCNVSVEGCNLDANGTMSVTLTETVGFVVSLPMTAAEFDDGKQQSFKEAIARTAGSICGMPTARAQHQGAVCSRTFFRRRSGRRACPPAIEGSTPHAGETARPEMSGIIGAIMGETSDVCKSAGPNRVILRVCTNQRSVYHTRWGLVVTDSHHSDNPRGGR